MHEEYVRMVEGADTAVLFIHGIVGSPNHFKELVPLVPDHVSVFNMLLDGHGGGVKDFSRSSMKKWEKQTRDTLSKLLETHESVYVAAHSMGTLLAIENAVCEPRIKGMLLLAVPIKLFWRPVMLRYILSIYFDKASPSDPVSKAARECYGIRIEKNLLSYTGWIPRYLELFHKIGRTKKLLPLVDTPCTAYQSRRDEVVSRRSVKYLNKRSRFTVKTLQSSGHYFYSPEDTELLKEEFSSLLNGVCKAVPRQERLS